MDRVEKIITIVTSGGATFFAVYKYWNEIKQLFKKESKTEKEFAVKKIYNLKQNSFFTNMISYKLDVDRLKTGNQMKDLLVKDYLLLKLLVFQKNYYEYFRKTDIMSITREELASDIKMVFGNCILDYKLIAKKNNVSDVFQEKFEEWHYERHVQFVDKQLDKILSKSIDDNNSVANQVLWLLEAGFVLTITDAFRTPDEFGKAFNGAITESLLKSPFYGICSDYLHNVCKGCLNCKVKEKK